MQNEKNKTFCRKFNHSEKSQLLFVDEKWCFLCPVTSLSRRTIFLENLHMQETETNSKDVTTSEQIVPSG
jgi:hypothetical protein